MKKTKTASKKAAVKKVSSTKTVSRLVFLSRHLRSVIIASGVIAVLLVFWSFYVAKAENEIEIVYENSYEDYARDPKMFDSGWFHDSLEVNDFIDQRASGSIVANDGTFYSWVKKFPIHSSFGPTCQSNFPVGLLADLDMYLDINWNNNAAIDYSLDLSKRVSIDPEANPNQGSQNVIPEANKKYFDFYIVRDANTKKLLVGTSQQHNLESPRDVLANTDHYIVNKTGWYTLRYIFKFPQLETNDEFYATALLINQTGNIVWRQTITDPELVGASVKFDCNTSLTAYNIPGLAIDHHRLINLKHQDLVGPPQTKDECTEDNWMNFNWQTVTEPTFKSQGDCVSFIESNEGSPGN